jgi:hypothetical protein
MRGGSPWGGSACVVLFPAENLVRHRIYSPALLIECRVGSAVSWS